MKALLSMAIKACKESGKYIGICGQGPSDHPDFARWLVDQGIDSLSLNPDTVVETWLYLANGAKSLGARWRDGRGPSLAANGNSLRVGTPPAPLARVEFVSRRFPVAPVERPDLH